jgi:hypothetical protein
MTATKAIAILLALGGLATAVTAAIYWLKASRVSAFHTAASPSDVTELYILSNEVAFNESSRLNAKAALWTGASAILNAVATGVGLF